MTDIRVEFITKTKLPIFNEDTQRTETVTYVPKQRATLPAGKADLAISNGWAREVSDDA
jgi:hypothetical protein